MLKKEKNIIVNIETALEVVNKTKLQKLQLGAYKLQYKRIKY